LHDNVTGTESTVIQQGYVALSNIEKLGYNYFMDMQIIKLYGALTLFSYNQG